MSSTDYEKEAFERLRTFYNLKSVEQVMDFYGTTFVETYEDDMTALRLQNAPKVFADFLLKYMKNTDKKAKILDIGAGTGLLGMELKKRDFHNLYGHDGSKEMLKMAKERNIYKECYEEIILENKPSVTMPKNGFDVLVSLGAFGCVQMNGKHLQGLIDLAKSGGFMLLGFNKSSYDDEFKHQMSLLSAQCSLIGSEVVEDYLLEKNKETGEVFHHQGIFLAFKIL